MADTVGDNREVTIITSVDLDVTFYINHANTTANDTATAKYFDLTLSPADKIVLRPTANCHIKEINGQELTDPITVTSSGYTETDCAKYYGGIASMKIIFHEDTQMKMRVIGRTAR